MTEERKRVLNSIDFLWNGNAPGTSTATWKEMYQRLVAYKKEHEDTNVPRSYKEDRQLGRWVNSQRYAYRREKITVERKRLLNYIGFVWAVRPQRTSTATWEEMFERLVAFKKEHKNTKIPQDYKEDPELGTWVMNQRATYRKKKMTEKRKRLLNSIGFVW